MKRDTQLDCYRSLAMIYIVCVIHALYLFNIELETLKSALLFEMPLIFFIAGASQSYKHDFNLRKTINNRLKRVLLPYYIFIFAIFVLYSACTALHTPFEGGTIDINNLGTTDIIKLLATGGSVYLPYMGYTWFISIYLIISCLLPLQQKIIRRTGGCIYTFACTVAFVLVCIFEIHSFEEVVERTLFYNIFYIIGFVFYKKLKTKYIAAIALPCAIISLYLIISDRAIPMQQHKFPPDMIFLLYNIGPLCLLSLFFSRVKIRYNRIIRLWNVRGYNIYLYQSVSMLMVYWLTDPLRTVINNELIYFMLLVAAIFAAATALSYITYPMERFVMKKVFNS